MKRLYILFFFTFFSISTFAQTYDAAAGIRVGTEWGATGKIRIGKVETVEAILQQSFGKDQTMFTALYEHHQKFVGKRFNVYKGGGLHYGMIGEDSRLAKPKDAFGVTAIGGIEATLARLNLSYDIKPAINLNGGGYKTIDLQTGVSARYVIDKRKTEILKGNKRKKRSKKQRSKVGQVFDDIFKRDN